MSDTTTTPNWYDPNLFAPVGGRNTEPGTPAGYGTVNSGRDFLGSIFAGGSTVFGGLPGALGILGSAMNGQAPDMMNTIGALGQALGFGGGTDEQQNAAGAASNPNVGGTAVETVGSDIGGSQAGPDGTKGFEGYAKGGSVSPHHHKVAGALAHMIVANPHHPVLGALARAAMMHHSMRRAA